MKPSHAAALALVGWYLMIPPFTKPQSSFNVWQIVASFETNDDCERNRKDFKANPPEPPLNLRDQVDIDDWHGRADHALCVSGDDLRQVNPK